MLTKTAANRTRRSIERARPACQQATSWWETSAGKRDLQEVSIKSRHFSFKSQLTIVKYQQDEQDVGELLLNRPVVGGVFSQQRMKPHRHDERERQEYEAEADLEGGVRGVEGFYL